MIDFRYHLVSIVAVFLALAIGIVLGSTALQGSTLDVLRSTVGSLQNQLNQVTAESDSNANRANADDSFLQNAEPKLLSGMLTGDNLVLVTEPGASSTVIGGIQTAAKDAGATITGTIALQPKFNDLSGATRADLGTINSEMAAPYGIALADAADTQTAYQQDAAQVIAGAVLQQTADEPGQLVVSDAETVLKAYVAGGYLSYQGSPFGTATDPAGFTTGRATLAVIVTPPASASDGPNNPLDEVLLAVAGQFATAAAAVLVAGGPVNQSLSSSPISVLRNSSVSGQVSSVDNANTTIGQISSVWALADQLAGGKPGSYGVSGASAVSPPVPSPVPSAAPTPTVTPTATPGTGKAKKTVSSK